jgi:hypothetical protein
MMVRKFRQWSGATAVLIIGGLVWIVRAGLDVVFQPDYWNPRTNVDYTAVAGTSIALILLAVGVWAIHLRQRSQGRWRTWLWRVGIILTCGGALIAGIANFGEDWIAIKSLGTFFVSGSLAMFVGLILGDMSAIGVASFPRWTGWLLMACALGLGRIEEEGGFIVGFALILLAVGQYRSIPTVNPQLPEPNGNPPP